MSDTQIDLCAAHGVIKNQCWACSNKNSSVECDDCWTATGRCVAHDDTEQRITLAYQRGIDEGRSGARDQIHEWQAECGDSDPNCAPHCMHHRMRMYLSGIASSEPKP